MSWKQPNAVSYYESIIVAKKAPLAVVQRKSAFLFFFFFLKYTQLQFNMDNSA